MKKECKISGCKKSELYRGVCKKCYYKLWALIRKNETTWQELEELDLVLPAIKNDQRRKSTMQEKLDLARAKAAKAKAKKK